MSRSFSVTAIVLNRRNYRDTDRFITVFSKEKGKLVGLAKGVRKLTSKKRASLEPGNLVKLSFATGKAHAYITESTLIHSFPEAKRSLLRITQTYQLLEIIDLLTVEDEPHPQVFNLLEITLQQLSVNGSKKPLLLENIRLILKDLGFTYDKQFSEQGLRRYIESLAERQLKTKQYLTLTP